MVVYELGTKFRAIQIRIQIIKCFWVKRGKALVLGGCASKDLRIWKAFLNKSFNVWDFSIPFKVTGPRNRRCLKDFGSTMSYIESYNVVIY